MLLQGCVDQGKDGHGGDAFCGPLPALEGSIAAQGEGLDPLFDVSGTPADSSAANVYRMRKGTPADASPDCCPASDAREAHDLMAGE